MKTITLNLQTRPMALAAALVMGAASVLAAAPAAAQVPDTLHACYVKGSGSVYRVGVPDAPVRCTKNTHIPFSWVSGGSASGGGQGGPPSGAAAGDLGGSFPAPTVIGLQGRPVFAGVPTDGQFLGWNAGQNRWEPRDAPAGGSAGAAAHSQLNGLAADDHPQYLLGEGVRHSTNGFAVTGTLGQGAIPTSSAGVRMMWYPAKAAFRAGEVSAAQWADQNIGSRSVAFGNNTRATGTESVALGNTTTAAGWAATALGWSSQASGEGSLATGGSTIASGSYATAMGAFSQASSQSAVALGHHANATGGYSTAFGYATQASGEHSTVMGRFAAADGHSGAFVYGDASTNGVSVKARQNNHFVVRAARFWFGNNNNVTATVGRFIETHTGAYLSSGGAWINSSDVNRKHGFRPVDGEQVLAKVAALPISTWSYNDDEGAVRHMGPTAQDFHAAFGLGDSDKAIATVDADGVSLAAIQALIRRGEAQQARLEQLERQNSELLGRIRTLEAQP